MPNNVRMFCRLTAPTLMSLLLLTGYAQAIDTLTFAIDHVDGDSWSAAGIEVQVMLGTADPVGAALKINRLVLPAPIGEMRHVRIDCAALTLSANEYRCARARAYVGDSLLDAETFTGDIRYSPQTQTIRASSGNLPLAGLRTTIDGQWDPSGWSGSLRVSNVAASSFFATLAERYPALPATDVAEGTVTIAVTASADSTAPTVMKATLDLQNLAVSNESGTLASDGLGAQLRIELEADDTADGYVYSMSLATDQGEAYFEPAYFNLEKTPLRVESAGSLSIDAKTLSVSQLAYRHSDTVTAKATAQLSWMENPAIDSATVTVEEATFPAAYRTYVQGFLVGTPLAKLQTDGKLRGGFDVRDNRLNAVDVYVEALNADDAEQLALYGAAGEIHWRSDDKPAKSLSRLSWDGGFIYAIGYGPGSLSLTLAGDDISLIDGLRVPVLNGALVVDTFLARDLISERPAMDFDARLEPIGLRRLTAALGWPAFPGTLSGELPLLRLRDGVITVGGSLVARVFDGTARISELRIESPFAANRQGFANITLNNLDLALITDVFSLGRISGRLDGRIDGLQTFKNTPVAFDAKFYTPPDDTSRHRISRRAINNLSEIAGGGTALLTGGFLKFFEEFSYDSIGFSCRLWGDLCEMGGLKTAPSGFYIVQGRGLPRIDVIGHQRDVNWPRLVSQINEALKSQDATTRQPSKNQP